MKAGISDHHITPEGFLKVVANAQASTSGDAIVATDYASDGIVAGYWFLTERNYTINNGATLNIVYDYTTYIPGQGQSGLIYVLPPFFHTTAGPVVVNVYRGTDYAGGTAQKFINPNTTAPKAESGTTILVGATGSTKGTLSMEYLVGGQSQGANSAAGDSTALAFFIRPNTGKTLIEIVNQSGSTIQFHNGQVIYEL